LKINIAKNAGFCFGVKNAVDTVIKNAKEGKKLFIYGDIIHNQHVIDYLSTLGVKKIDDLNGLHRLKGETAVIRSHGAPPEVYEAFLKEGIEVIDATCPFVKRIHDMVKAAEEKGVAVIIVGEEKHPEVLGIKGWAGDNSYVVYDEQDVDNLPCLESAVLVAQTTTPKSKWLELLPLIKEKVLNLDANMTICETTERRQEEAEKLAKNSDVMIVVGGKNSSNTKRLYDLCKKYCKRTYHIENINETVLENLRRTDIINIIAGASTPDWLIREVFLRMSENENMLVETETVGTEDTVKGEIQAEEMRANEASESEGQSADGQNETLKSSDDSFMEEVEKSFVKIRRGQFVIGTVVQLTDEEAFVNIGYKSDGILTKSEFSVDGSISPKSILNVGDEVEVEIISLNDGQGNVLLSKKRIDARAKWNEFAKDAEEGKGEKEYTCKINKVIKGGLLGKIEGYDTFIPASQTSLKYVEDLKVFLGKELSVVIIEIDKAKKRIVASHRAILKKEEEKKLDELWSRYSKGDQVTGTVKRITDFGAFVDTGGVDALLHIKDISWINIKSPADVLSVGQVITTLILYVDVQRRRISLGLKQLSPKPWDLVEEKYLIGSVIDVKVVRTVPFGAFVELEPGVDGLIHISQIANRRLERAEDEIKVGDIVKVKVMEVDAKKKKISLSRRQLIIEEQEKAPKTEEKHTENEERYEIPPVKEMTVSLGDFFPKNDTEGEE